MPLRLAFDSRICLPPSFAARVEQLQGTNFTQLSSTSYQCGDVLLQYGTMADGRTAWAMSAGGTADLIFEPTHQHLVCTNGSVRPQRWFAVHGKSTVELAGFAFVQTQCEESTLMELNRAVNQVLYAGKSQCYEGLEKRLEAFLSSAASNTEAVNTALKQHSEGSQRAMQNLTQTLAVRFAADDAKMTATFQQFSAETEHKIQMARLQSSGEVQETCYAQMVVAEELQNELTIVCGVCLIMDTHHKRFQ
jgi:hypothetical protein